MRIWCVEDDAGIREIEVYTLKNVGFEAEGFCDASSFFEELKNNTPDLVILDIMLPGEDGTTVLRRLKENKKTADIPVIMASAKSLEYDKIENLDIGADDYLVKPFGMMEMVSRVKAVLRRTKKCTDDKKPSVFTVGDIRLDTDSRTVEASGRTVELTFKEFEVLKCFISNPGTVFSRDRLFLEVWGSDYIGETRTVDMHIRSLRQKLGKSGETIKTVRGAGYKLEV